MSTKLHNVHHKLQSISRSLFLSPYHLHSIPFSWQILSTKSLAGILPSTASIAQACNTSLWLLYVHCSAVHSFNIVAHLSNSSSHPLIVTSPHLHTARLWFYCTSLSPFFLPSLPPSLSPSLSLILPYTLPPSFLPLHLPFLSHCLTLPLSYAPSILQSYHSIILLLILLHLL